jgi:hypothetical protein
MRYSRIALAALAVLATGCLDSQKLGPLAPPPGGTNFSHYIAIGTSISAGVQSGGISDSTQKRAFPYLLAKAMGFTPNTDWFYPGFTAPGCPAPFTNPLTGTRVGGGSATGCNLISPLSVPRSQTYFNNLGVPFMRVGQALNIASLLVPATDTLKLATFVTGGRNPVDIIQQALPSFVTVELGVSDVAGAVVSGDTTRMTPLTVSQRQYDSLAAAIATTGAKVALANVSPAGYVPYVTRGHIFFCLKTGACPGVPATLPFSLATFTVDPSCAPTTAGGVGDQMAVALPATATIAGTLSGGGGASLNCGAGTATVTTTATSPVGPIVSVAAMAAITQRVTDFNTKIAAVATAHNWALVNFDSAGTVLLASGAIPPIPNLATPTNLFGTLFSLDGLNASTLSHKLMADLFVAAINAKYGTALTPP